MRIPNPAYRSKRLYCAISTSTRVYVTQPLQLFIFALIAQALLYFLPQISKLFAYISPIASLIEHKNILMYFDLLAALHRLCCTDLRSTARVNLDDIVVQQAPLTHECALDIPDKIIITCMLFAADITNNDDSKAVWL